MKTHSFPSFRIALAFGLPCLFMLLGPQPASAQFQQEGPSAGQNPDAFAVLIDSGLQWAVRGIEVAGIAVIVVGALTCSVIYAYRTLRSGPKEVEYHGFRASLGRTILLGLEFLVAADIINTVAIDPTLESVAVLAAVVAVRTFLSFALEVEIEGTWPWNRNRS
jgi:uncharacterized membrane protein